MRGKRLKINYPHVIADTDRHGNVRVYYRRKGKPKVRLWEPPGTLEFQQELDAAKGKTEAAPSDADEIRPGSLRALCVEYFGVPAFTQLDPITQSRRRSILERICQSLTDKKVLRGTLPFARMEAEHVEAIRDDALADGIEAANGRVKALRQLFKWAKKPKKLKINPALEVEYLESDSDGHHTWTIEEVEQYQGHHPVGRPARLAMDLLLYTGTRRSDMVKLGPPMERDEVLHFTEWKNSRRKIKRRKEGPKQQALPILPVLRATIDATTCGIRTYLVTSFGKPFTANGFGNRFEKWCKAAGLPDWCRAHGLRKAGATFAADNGATEAQLMAIYGWDDPKQAALYTKKANRKRLAASGMHLLEPTRENEPSPKVSHSLPRGVSHPVKLSVKSRP